MNLIKDTTTFTRADLPDVIKQTQKCLAGWLETLPASAARRVKARLPKFHPSLLRVEVLGAIDEDQAIYQDAREVLVRVQCFLDHHELPEDTDGRPYQELSKDLSMLLLVSLLRDWRWLLRTHQEALRRGLTPAATREYVNAEFVTRAKEDEWIKT